MQVLFRSRELEGLHTSDNTGQPVSKGFIAMLAQVQGESDIVMLRLVLLLALTDKRACPQVGSRICKALSGLFRLRLARAENTLGASLSAFPPLPAIQAHTSYSQDASKLQHALNPEPRRENPAATVRH